MNGVYILADDSMEEMAVACLNSLRVAEPLIPICLIPYSLQCERIRSSSRKYGLSVWEDKSALELCDEISAMFHPQAIGHYRKLVAWMGNFDRFIYLDIDTVYLRRLEPLFSLLDFHDVIVAKSNMRSIKRFVWKESFDGNGSSVDTQYAANTGFILSKRELFSRATLRDHARAAVPLKHHMVLECAEQPLLNYIITASGAKYSSLSVLRREDHSIPEEIWGGKWSGNLLDLEELPLSIHWAGVWRNGRHEATRLWQHFRQLPMPPQ
jgi:hypothetical protein